MQKIKLTAKQVTLNQTMLQYNISMTGSSQIYISYQLLSDKGMVIASGKLLRQPSEYAIWAAGNSPDNMAAISKILSEELEVNADSDQTMPLTRFEENQQRMKQKQEKRKSAPPVNKSSL